MLNVAKQFALEMKIFIKEESQVLIVTGCGVVRHCAIGDIAIQQDVVSIWRYYNVLYSS